MSDKNNADNKEVRSADINQDYKLSAYSGFSMINVLVAALTMVLSMITYAKPMFYYLEANYGKEDGDYLYLLSIVAVSDGDIAKANRIYLIAAILVAVSAVIALVSMVKATKQEKKPLVLLSIAGFLAAVAGMVICLWGASFIGSSYAENPFMTELQLSRKLNVFGAQYIVVIINAVAALVNIVFTSLARGKWKKTGKSF